MLKKIVLTGAAGDLGSRLREPLSRMCEQLVSVDIKDATGPLAANETWARADCAEMDQVTPLMEGAEVVVHFAAIPDERSFEELLRPNFLSSYVIWEAAYKAGARRVVYASSVHAVGMHETNAGIDTDAPHRPDTFYGLSKCFTEDLARLYWEKRGLEAVCCRIFSGTEKPQNPRALGTWLSRGDLVQMVERAVDAPTTGFCVVFGISNNDRAPVSNAKVSFLGYRPKDNAEDHAADILAKAAKPDPQNLAQMRLGGPFATVPLGESGVAGMAKLVKKG
ncbi:UDP-glucose 4-epimerase [Rubellimicrobium mesophilum DSM 19309]|uniref:UDP-glucose 4-epimerase n=1 Tax=Rubellimicrobium mesophilum DSM 19309 TaxID=442562 RepID=A0A017HUA5_9RHOB|nr:NAD(P)-dependent oxidoreductase [Rubellimicrobium mesophilum]EYD77344.1 UDP-glucose 4-epimerase [Rubellimicrobium mesophilum DSM 19309]